MTDSAGVRSLDVFSLLARFSQTSAPSGSEGPVRDLFLEEARPYVDEAYVDRMGSAVALKRGQGREPRRKLLLAAHMDEVGFTVSQLEGAFLRFHEIGGFDPRVLIGQEVLIHTEQGPLAALVASRPPHVLSREEREKVPPSAKLYLDPGLPAEELRRRVRVGDVATFRRQLLRLGEHLAAGKALDNRAAVVLLLLALAELVTLRHDWDVYAVATAQEEDGAPYLGASTSTYAIQPQVGVAVDVTHGEMPGVAESRTVPLGKGPSVAIGPNIHPLLHRRLCELAEAREIPYVSEPEPGPTHTDAWAIQITAEGVPTALLGIPLRYMHSSVEALDLRDLERGARLLAAFAASLDEELLSSLRAW